MRARIFGLHPAAILAVAVMTLAASGVVLIARSEAEPLATTGNPFAVVDAEGGPGAPPSVSLQAPTIFRRSARLTAIAMPPSPGTRVYVQALEGRIWKTIRSGIQDFAGRAVIAWRPARAGIFTIRSAVATDADGPARYSAPVNVSSLAPDARIVTWREWVEPGLGGPAEFVRVLVEVLGDARGWGATGEVAFRYKAAGPVDVIARLATPRTTDRLCYPADTRLKWSCRNSSGIVINSERWFKGSPTLPMPVVEYRAMVINHEIGHALGFGHATCGGLGSQAPVMMQQSKGLHGCTANPWPLPREIARL